jgi:soluble lytic murein transglycosylase
MAPADEASALPHRGTPVIRPIFASTRKRSALRLPSRRFVYVVLTAAALALAEVQPRPLSAADLAALRTAVAAVEAGGWNPAAAGPVTDPLSLKILQWLDYARPGAPGGFAEIARFIDANPDWPRQRALREHAEEALAAEPDAVAAEWLGRHPPLAAVGRVRAAELLLKAGAAAGGTAAVRAVWVDGDFAPPDEKHFLEKHGAAIRPEDDRRRLDRLLWEHQSAAASRLLPRVSPDLRAVAEARLALAAGAAGAASLFARVAPPLRRDDGLLYDEVRWLRGKGGTDAAALILEDHPGDPVHPAAWAVERQIVSRQLLATGDARRAYHIVEEHGAIDGDLGADAALLQGFIALRYRRDAALAFADFSLGLDCAESAEAKARTGYWSGRAAAAYGNGVLATERYALGAMQIGTFYGQLAAHQLGSDAPPHPLPEPPPSAVERARFDASELVGATRIFLALGDRRNTKRFLIHLADRAKTPTEFAMLAGLAQDNGRTDLAIAIAKRAVAAGAPLLAHGYPTIALPQGGIVEPALIYAVIRQESGFETDAVSRSGALGLMQLMPATASWIAPKLPLPFSLASLTADGSYNIALGRGYLEKLLEDFGGSYALAIAGYNAGPGRVRQWLQDHGDPRGEAIAMVDWIELIPIAETRRYVERVLENLQVYRGQDGSSSAFSLVSDLAR